MSAFLSERTRRFSGLVRLRRIPIREMPMCQGDVQFHREIAEVSFGALLQGRDEMPFGLQEAGVAQSGILFHATHERSPECPLRPDQVRLVPCVDSDPICLARIPECTLSMSGEQFQASAMD